MSTAAKTGIFYETRRAAAILATVALSVLGASPVRHLVVPMMALSAIPYYLLGLVLVYLLGIVAPVFPISGGYNVGTVPTPTWGFDINPVRVKESLENVEKNNVKNLVTIKEADVFTLDLSKADVITLYLLPQLNVKLIPQLDKLKPGCRIVSHDFNMEGVKPKREITFTPPGGREHRIYLWVTPLEKERR